MSDNYLFTSESVSEGHPDKICDQISDAVVDLYLKNSDQKDQVRVACETMVTTNKVIIAGEVRGPDISNAEIENITREVVKDIGYEQDNFHWKNFDFNCFLQILGAAGIAESSILISKDFNSNFVNFLTRKIRNGFPRAWRKHQRILTSRFFTILWSQ